MRYLRLLRLFFKNSIQVELEYRANFLMNLVVSLLWFSTRIVSVLVFYQHRETLGGWTVDQVLIILGLFNIFNGLIDGVLTPNVQRVVEHIRQGTLDFILLKPANSQFLASLRSFAIWNSTDVLTGSGIILYALWRLQVWPTPGDLLATAIMLGAGIVTVYSFWMLLVTTAFWFVRVENVTEIFNIFFTTGRFPVTAFHPWLQIFLTFVVPIAFLTTFPASALLGGLALSYVLGSVVMALTLLGASVVFWNFAIRFYSSASS